MLTDLGLFPEAASTVAGRVDALYFFLIAISLFFSIGIAGILITFGIRFRRRSPHDQAEQIHGSLVLELAWSIIPFGIAMVIFFWGASIYVTLKRPPNDSLQVFVVGRQWMWKLQHLEGKREINELHVPVGMPVRLTLTSEDVIHSFYVPAFRIKQDAVPGRYTTAWFQATKPGTYHLFCAEYCGTEHSRMIGRIVVLEPAEYQAWLAMPSGVQTAAAGGVQSVAASGEALFTGLGCATCHKPQSGALGPSLIGVFGKSVTFQDGATITVDEAYLRESILDPQTRVVRGFQPVMPTFRGQISEEQILQLITYIRSLSAPPAGAGQASTGTPDASRDS
jgi:cytochrome c oxidase subunit 2